VSQGWRPTHTLLRAALLSAAVALAAVLLGRPDALVLVAPLAMHAAVAVVRRPAVPPQARSTLLHDSLREGEATVSRTRLRDADGAEHAVVALAPHPWTAFEPPHGVVGVAAARPGSDLLLDVRVSSLRWGRRPVGNGVVAATGPWAGYRWGPAAFGPTSLTTLPLPGRFDAGAPAPHPIGVVGTHPARRPGEGSEFASIRPFTIGDRPRRVNWRVSQRTGSLHVTSTAAEEDTSVLLLVDSCVEIGTSAGVRGAASSLDVAVRAAGAVAEHYLHAGDRVGLRVLGSTRHNAAPTAAGRRHLRRLLDTMARVTPGEDLDRDPAQMQFRVPAGTVVLVFSPMLAERAVVATTTLAHRGLPVVVVDCLPEEVDLGDDELLRVAWRLRRLEREQLLARVARVGIPVVPWRGPGTLDEVLRRLGRRAALPTLVRR
jgi:uncharacterized protein (DUF58 family)